MHTRGPVGQRPALGIADAPPTERGHLTPTSQGSGNLAPPIGLSKASPSQETVPEVAMNLVRLDVDLSAARQPNPHHSRCWKCRQTLKVIAAVQPLQSSNISAQRFIGTLHKSPPFTIIPRSVQG